MLTDERSLKPGLFSSPDGRVARNILIPGFRAATAVRGAFGWFTAGWIQQLAPGLAVYLARDDTDPMEFTVAPALFSAERGAVERGVQMTEEEAAALVAHVFIEGRVDAEPIALHALDCLSWMIATEALRLRIAVPTPESNYHPKLWLFDDGENQVLARGSGNATGKGVDAGVEHLDVDVSWQRDSRVPAGVSMLNNWSTGQSPGISKVFDLPEAIARDIIQTAPAQAPQPNEYDVLAVRDRTMSKRPPPQPPPRLRTPDYLVPVHNFGFLRCGAGGGGVFHCPTVAGSMHEQSSRPPAQAGDGPSRRPFSALAAMRPASARGRPPACLPVAGKGGGQAGFGRSRAIRIRLWANTAEWT